jgi:predicted transcriptional regulator of viral defense system
MDWVNILAEESRRNDLLFVDQLVEQYKVDPKSVSKALLRYENRGLIERVTHKVYINKLSSDFSSQDLVNVLRPNAYVSLESALHFWGLSTQSTAVLTCVTTGKPYYFKGKSFAVKYRSISENLYWGFVQKRTRYGIYKIAEPEKALLDFVYLALQEGNKNPSLDELDFSRLDRKKLNRYLSRYPASVRKALLPELAGVPIAV